MNESDLSAEQLAELDRGEGPYVRVGDAIYERTFAQRMSDPGDWRVVDPKHPLYELTPAQRLRAVGVLVGTAVGDAVGVHYELGSAPLPPPGTPVDMLGGGLGGSAPGEWSDDTAMAICLAEAGARGLDLGSAAGLDAIAQRFLAWARSRPSDMGIATRAVLGDGVLDDGPGVGARLTARAAEVHARTGRTAGNGALMRTGPVGVAHVHDRPWVRARAARAVAELTHTDPLAGDSCVLWTEGIATAIRTGTTAGVRSGLKQLPRERRASWKTWLKHAETRAPATFRPNGFTVNSLQAAYASVLAAERSHGTPTEKFVTGIETAVRIGDDTDTTAAIAGALLGAQYGREAVPDRWSTRVHGWPGHSLKAISGLGSQASHVPREGARPTGEHP